MKSVSVLGLRAVLQNEDFLSSSHLFKGLFDPDWVLSFRLESGKVKFRLGQGLDI